MEAINLSPHQRDVALGALKAIALADGVLEDHERGLLRAAARALDRDDDPDALPTISPEEAAQALPDTLARTRLVQAQLIMALMDGETTPQELQILRAFSQALGVEEPRLHNLEQHLKGHVRMLQLDLMRRSQMMDDVVRAAWHQAGVKGVWKVFAPFQGGGLDSELAWRYKELGLLPEGTFGRTYWAHMTRRHFSFPGEGRGFPELLVKHDLCHVLGGYDTDPVGECEVIAFIAGFMEADPFWYIFAIFMHMHLGVEVFQGDPTGRFAFDPERVIRALRRGMAVNADLYDTGWDFWSLFPLPLDEVRARYNILPDAPPGAA